MQHLAHDDTARSIQSWMLSTFIHGLAFGAALMVLSDLPKLAQREPFTWTISLVEPSPRPIPAPEADAPSPPPSAKPAQPAPVQARRAEATPIVRSTQRAREIVQQEPAEATSFVQEAGPLTQQTQQVVSHAPSPILTSRQPVSVETPSTPTAQSGSADRAVESAVARVDTPSPIIPHQALQGQTASDTIDDLTGPPSANRSAPPSTLQAPISAQAEAGDRPSLPPAQPAAQTADPGVSSAQESPRPIHDAPVTTVVKNHPPIGRTLSLHPDYGWLTDALRRRVESLKAYPRLARAQGWEGRVVVRATIKDDGSLLHETVEESSGHETLDQDALDLMKRVCPLALKHPLGQQQVVVHVPIHYRIEQ